MDIKNVINRAGLTKLSSAGTCSIYELNNKKSKFSKPLFFNKNEIIYSPKNIIECCFKYLDYIVENKLICAASPRPNFHIGIAKRYGLSYIKHGETAFLFNENDYKSDTIIGDYESENKVTVDDAFSYVTPTGTISLLDARNELGMSGQIDMNNANVRRLAGKPNGTISLADLRGKSNQLVYRMYVGDNNGDGSTEFNWFGYYHEGKFGSISPNVVEGTSGLYILMISSVMVVSKGVYESTIVIAHNLLAQSGVKHTNYVDATIQGRTFRFAISYYEGSYSYVAQDHKGVGEHLRSLYRKTVDIKLKWFN